MKKVLIVHCWSGYPEYCWYPWVKTELTKRGFQVDVPTFPNTDFPNLSKWLPVLKEKIGNPNEDTCLIGHSIGCATILRYLESLNEGEKVGGVVLVAGFTDNLNFEELKNFFETDLDFERIKSKANHFSLIHSDNDPYVPLKYGNILKEKLGAELIIKHNAGHFSGPVDKEDSCLELPEVLESIDKMIKI